MSEHEQLRLEPSNGVRPEPSEGQEPPPGKGSDPASASLDHPAPTPTGSDPASAPLDHPVPPPPGSDPASAPLPHPWTDEQRRAIAASDPYVFVEAGAGSGKTGILVARYCDAVEAAEAGPDAVLAFTFTEKAAGELRARVRAELRRRAAAADEEGDRDRGRRLRELARSPGAWLTTIHGFCRRLLAAHPIAAGIDPGFRVLDAIEAELLAERAFDDAFDTLLAEPDPARLALAAGRGRAVLRDLVRGAHDELRSLGSERPALEPLPGPDLGSALDHLSRAASAALEELEGQSGAAVDGCRERISSAAGLAPAYRSGSVPEIEEVGALAIRGKRFDGEAITAYNAAVKRAVERLAGDLYEALREVVELFGRRYAELKAERSGLDFEDLQLRAVRLLRESDAVREAWCERFDALLVDEFQDTNRVQVNLVEMLSADSNRLFTVGDEFQAIYGFRHADVSVFRAERERGRRLELRGNFRSDPAVLAAANAIGEVLLPGYRPLTAGRAVGGGEAAAELLLVERGAWEEESVGLADRGRLDAPAERVAEASQLAQRLAQLAEPEDRGGAGISRGEMVVLLRAFTHVSAYEDALERAGLRPLIVGGRGYWSQQQVEDMRCLLATVANPLEDEALLGALSSPACGASPDALWLLREAAGQGRHLWLALERILREGSDPIGRGDAERLRLFTERLTGLRRRAPLLALDALVDEAARVFEYDLAVLQLDRGRRRWANVRKLMRLARAYEEANGRDLAGFLAMVGARAEREDREPEAQTEIEGHDGVRVMTTHNAKGLEFGVVAVADLGRELGAGGFPPAFRARAGEDGVRFGVRLARAGGPSLRLFELEDLAAEASAEESAEDRRLAYVAATRAQRRLLLSGVVDPKALGSQGSGNPDRASVVARLLSALGIGIDEDGLTVDGDPDLPGADIDLTPNGDVIAHLPAPAALAGGPGPERAELKVHLIRAVEGIGAELLATRPAGAAAGAELPSGPSPLAAGPARPPARPATGQLSNAALALYGRCAYRFYAERVLGLAELDADGAGERSLALGSAVHSLLEWSARNRWLEPPRDRCAAALAHAGIEPAEAEVDRVTALAEGWLGSPLKAELAESRARTSPEAPFLLEVEGEVVRGTLDLLATTPGGPPTVVDYKTNALRGRPPAELMATYETQRDLYALAAAEALAAETVRTAFVFLEAPGDPVVRDHDADALAATRKRLERLVAGISDGAFEVSDAPHRELCLTCPARPRLCSHPFERTMAA